MDVWGVSHAHTHTCTCMHMHICTHTCMLNMINMLNMDASMLVAICNFYTCVHACACMCMHVGTPPYAPRCPQTPPTHLPPPQSRREPKTPKFNKSCTNRDNLILFEDSLPLNIPELILTIVVHPGYPPTRLPHPQSQGNPNRKNYNNF